VADRDMLNSYLMSTDLATLQGFVTDLGNLTAIAKSSQKMCSVSLP